MDKTALSLNLFFKKWTIISFVVVFPLLPVIATFVKDNFLRISFDNSIKKFLPDLTIAYPALDSCSLFVMKNNGFCFNTSAIKLFPSNLCPSKAKKISFFLNVRESILIFDESNIKSSSRLLVLIKRCFISLMDNFIINLCPSLLFYHKNQLFYF